MKIVPITTIPLDSIEPDPKNPNEMVPYQQKALNDTIDKFGYAQEIWVRKVGKKHIIIDGEHRYNYLKANNIKEAPVRIFKVDETDAAILRQVSYRLRGGHDRVKTLEEIKGIFDAGKYDVFKSLARSTNQSSGGLASKGSTVEIDIMLQDKYHLLDRPEFTPHKTIYGDTTKKVSDEIQARKEAHKIKKSKIYKLGDHLLMCGDCTDPPNLSLIHI